MPRPRFYDDRNTEEDDETIEAYFGEDPPDQRLSRICSRSLKDLRDRGRQRGRRRDGRRVRDRSESEETRNRPRSFVAQKFGADDAGYEEELLHCFLMFHEV